MLDQDLELLSYRICPFVARAMIIAHEKGLTPGIRYIDIDDKPAWFLELSPTGNVPALRVGNRLVFESSVIAEYLDEVTPPSLLPAEPLLRAEQRAWTEFSSRLIFEQYSMMLATDEAELQENAKVLRRDCETLERRMGPGPYFGGEQFSIIDAAYAPLLCRTAIFRRWFGLDTLHDLPRLEQWRQELARRESVKRQFDEEFESALLAHLEDKNSHLLSSRKMV